MSKNAISELQEYAQKFLKTLPDYTIVRSNNLNDNSGSFVAIVKINELVAKGYGDNKKNAKLSAATNLLANLNQTSPNFSCENKGITKPSYIKKTIPNCNVTSAEKSSCMNKEIELDNINYVGKLNVSLFCSLF